MRTNAQPFTWLMFFVWLLFGCATPDRIILLPLADGSPSAIVVKIRATR